MDLRRRELLLRTGGLSLAGLVAAALPAARTLAQSGPGPLDRDGTLQAFADTIIPGRKVDRTESGAPIAPGAIAGVHPLPGAVETDVLLLYRHEKVGFDALEPAFLADLEQRAGRRGTNFLALGFEKRTEVCLEGLDFGNPSRTLWEAAAAVPFTAFCAAALSEEQTAEKAAGYRVMGLPGRNLKGYRDFSYGRRLSRERTRTGSLG
jgi:hypothetical protein